jgi:CysZ protein
VTAASPPRSAFSEAGQGLRLLARGFGMYAKYPKLLVLGLIPAIISFLVLIAAFIALVVFLDDLGRWITSWFADDWSSGTRGGVRLLIEAAILIGSLWLAIITYTALTLVIGDPFYEKISERIENSLGGSGAGAELPWYRTLPRNIADSLRVVATQIVLAIPVLLLGLIPVVGQIAAPVVGALIGGWLICVDMTGIPFNRRGLFLRERRQLLRRHRALAMGFGVPIAVLMLIPFLNILVVPAGIAGATLLTRYLHGQPIE